MVALLGDGVAVRLNDPGDNSVLYDASDERAAFLAMQMPGASAADGRAGRRPGPLAVTVGGSPEQVTVPQHAGTVTDPDGGAYFYSLTSDVEKTMGARPAAGNSRKDLLAVHIYDADVHPAETTLRQLSLEVVQGTEGASPAEPTLPDGALRIGVLTVPDTGTVSVKIDGPRTVALGGILPVANKAERDALTAYDGLLVYREDADAFDARVAGAWVPLTGTSWGDTWTSRSFASGWGGNAYFQVQSVGGAIYVEASAQRTGGNIGNNDNPVDLATIPAEMYPDHLLYLAATSGQVGVDMQVLVDIDGSVKVRNRGTATFNSGQYIQLVASFLPA